MTPAEVAELTVDQAEEFRRLQREEIRELNRARSKRK
jgi:hypothetical protein